MRMCFLNVGLYNTVPPVPIPRQGLQLVSQWVLIYTDIFSKDIWLHILPSPLNLFKLLPKRDLWSKPLLIYDMWPFVLRVTLKRVYPMQFTKLCLLTINSLLFEHKKALICVTSTAFQSTAMVLPHMFYWKHLQQVFLSPDFHLLSFCIILCSESVQFPWNTQYNVSSSQERGPFWPLLKYSSLWAIFLSRLPWLNSCAVCLTITEGSKPPRVGKRQAPFFRLWQLGTFLNKTSFAVNDYFLFGHCFWYVEHEWPFWCTRISLGYNPLFDNIFGDHHTKTHV